MAEVSVVARIFSEDAEKFDEIKENLSKQIRVVDAKVEEIGFGVKILRVLFVVPDTQSDFEERIKSIPGVSGVQIDDVSLL